MILVLEVNTLAEYWKRFNLNFITTVNSLKKNIKFLFLQSRDIIVINKPMITSISIFDNTHYHTIIKNTIIIDLVLRT